MNSPFRGLRRTASGGSGGNTYPYPRTHTTVMVIPSNRQPSSNTSKNGDWSSASSLADDSPTNSLSTLNFDSSNTGPSYGFERRRPPLNRAIPPIPESKSNESIMSQASKSIAGTPCEPKLSALELVEEVAEDKSVPTDPTLENTSNIITSPFSNDTNSPEVSMVLSPVPLISKTANNKPINNTTKTEPLKFAKTDIPLKDSKIKQPKTFNAIKKNSCNRAEAPKSPLLSMAHSVRSRLTMLGTKFGRSDSRSPIRSSTSLTAMSKKEKTPPSKMAKSCSMHATQPNSATTEDITVLTTNSVSPSRLGRSDIPLKRPQITLIPSPSRSPRPLLFDLQRDVCSSKPATIPEESSIKEDESSKAEVQTDAQKTAEKMNDAISSKNPNDDVLPETETFLTASLVNKNAMDVPLVESKITSKTVQVSAAITSPTSATTTSSNTDTVYSGNTTTTTRPLTSPDWSEVSNPKATVDSGPVETVVSCNNVKNASVEADECEVKPLTPPIKKESVKKGKPEKTKSEKTESTTAVSGANKKTKESTDKPKTPKLAAKLGMAFGSYNNKQAKALKVLPSPKIKPKKGSSVLKRSTDDSTETELTGKTPRKSFSFEAKTQKPTEVRRNSEMKLIKKIERSLIPLIPHSNSRMRVDGNKNLDFRGINVKSVNSKNRRAPLAEFESSRVENSPAVELPPIGFERLSSSPGQRRRAQAANAISTIARTSTTVTRDSNGNLVTITETTETPQINATEGQEAQKKASLTPAIKTDTATETQSRPDKVTNTVAVQNGALKESAVAVDLDVDMAAVTDQFDKMTVEVENEGPCSRPMEMTISPLSTTAASISDTKLSKHSDQNANETESPVLDSRRFSKEDIDAIKTRLIALQDILVESPEKAPELMLGDSRVEELSNENECLRRQLQDRDRLIETLREQLAKVGGKV